MSIALFRPRYEVNECVEEIRKVLESGWSGLGPKCSEFEKQWCAFTGAANSHFVSSATAALHVAVRLLDLPKGTPVATTPLTFVSSNAAILYEGLVPVFCDCGKDLSLSFESVRRAVEEKGAKAVVWVHHGGNVSLDFYKMMEYAKNAGIKVVEDCAHASGASYKDGSRVGSRTDTVSCFSFHSVKNLPIFDGGFVCVPSKEADARARRLSWLGIDKSTYSRTTGGTNEVYKWAYDVPELGWKYNGNDVAASIGLVQLKYLDRDNAYRKAIAERYADRLKGTSVDFVEHQKGSSRHLVVARVADRDRVIAAMKANGMAPGVHYMPNYMFPVFAGFDRSLCETMDKDWKGIVSLPNHMCLSMADVDEVCKVVVNA